jgi:hypothetical protein
MTLSRLQSPCAKLPGVARELRFAILRCEGVRATLHLGRTSRATIGYHWSPIHLTLAALPPPSFCLQLPILMLFVSPRLHRDRTHQTNHAVGSTSSTMTRWRSACWKPSSWPLPCPATSPRTSPSPCPRSTPRRPRTSSSASSAVPSSSCRRANSTTKVVGAGVVSSTQSSVGSSPPTCRQPSRPPRTRRASSGTTTFDRCCGSS